MALNAVNLEPVDFASQIRLFSFIEHDRKQNTDTTGLTDVAFFLLKFARITIIDLLPSFCDSKMAERSEAKSVKQSFISARKIYFVPYLQAEVNAFVRMPAMHKRVL